MKKIFFVLSIVMAISSCAQTTKSAGTVPKELITNDSIYWMISTVSSVGYVNTTYGPNYNSYKSGGGMIVKFKFKENGRFEFLLYVQANTYGIDNEAWTQVEGTVEFKKDAKGQQVFVTKAEKGTYRVTKNGSTSSRAIPKSELEGQHSCTFLWEKTKLADDPNHTYLLMVDMEQHPNIDLNDPKSIDPSWVSKFHIPLK
jgi:hypothetical protein